MLESAIQVNLFLTGYCQQLLDGIADERLTEQPIAGVNHPAWILGHLAWTADRALEVLGSPALLPAEWATLYGRGSTPAASRAVYPSKDELVRAFEAGYEQLRQKASAASDEQLSLPTTNPRAKGTLPTQKEFLAFLMTGHVGVHLGQLSTWRRLISLPPMF
jgi:hypothetical protein